MASSEAPRPAPSSTRRVLGRYLLFQTPGWSAAGLAAWLAPSWLGVPGWACALGFAAWVVKDLALFPFVRSAYEDGGDGDARGLVGASAVATEPLSPAGFVRAGSELWRAELRPGSPHVARGERVRVQAVEGLTLVVVAEERDVPQRESVGGDR